MDYAILFEGLSKLRLLTVYLFLSYRKLSDSIYNQLMHLVQHVFSYDVKNAERTVKQLIACAKEKTLVRYFERDDLKVSVVQMTVFRLGESQRQDVDHAILTALLKGQGLSPSGNNSC